jgi:hypothetical protein
MEEQSFRDLIDIKDNNNVPLLDVLYPKIKKAIVTGSDTVSLLVTLKGPSRLFMATVKKDAFPIFLDEYIRWSEESEEYERCQEIMDLIKMAQKE